jgi:extracellular elastinolytic metalloproteinase
MARSLNYQTFDPQNQDMRYVIHPEPDFNKLKQYNIGNWINSNSSVPDNLIIKSDDYTHSLSNLTVPITTQYDFTKPILDPLNLHLLTQHVYYTLNVVHDILYNYQFNELNGNFQISKSSKPDPMIVDVSLMIKNDAFFIPADDGVSGIIRLGIDSITQNHFSMDPVVIIHEYFHGVSTRLVGGPSNSECLSMGEGVALGEGISDILALLLTMDGTETRQTVKYIGQFIYGGTKGYRKYGYSTDMNVNPLVYSMNITNPHDRGEVFAVTMYEIYWNLVDHYGFTKNLLDSNRMMGNVVLLKLMVESLKILNCYGGFLEMRDAIMLADETFYGGSNYCMLWNGFGKRGLGINSVLGLDSFDVPDKCKAAVATMPVADMDNGISIYGPKVVVEGSVIVTTIKSTSLQTDTPNNDNSIHSSSISVQGYIAPYIVAAMLYA